MLQLIFNPGLALTGFRTTRPRCTAEMINVRLVYVSMIAYFKTWFRFGQMELHVDHDKENGILAANVIRLSLILVKMSVEISGRFGSDRLNVKRMQHLLPLPLCVLYQLWVRNKNALIKTKHSNVQYLSIPLWSRANVKGYVVGNMRKCPDEKILWVLQSNLFFYGPLRCYNIHGKQRTRNVTSSQLAW